MGKIIIDYLEKSFLELLLGTGALVISLVQGQGKTPPILLENKAGKNWRFLGKL